MTSVLWACLVLSAQAQGEGELQNGDFVATWRMRDLPTEQIIPKDWFASQPETTGTPWVRMLEGDQTGVEIQAGAEDHYLFQDVRIDAGQTWTLKWKCKGSGSAAVSVLPRDDDGNFFPATSQTCPLTDQVEEHEMAITLPGEARVIRIILTPQPPSTTVNFESVELVSS